MHHIIGIWISFLILSTLDLLDKEDGIFRELDIDEKIINDMIMKAREKWFKEEEGKEEEEKEEEEKEEEEKE